jgi:hypothetical protein
MSFFNSQMSFSQQISVKNLFFYFRLQAGLTANGTCLEHQHIDLPARLYYPLHTIYFSFVLRPVLSLI